jgi:addiction module RelB/DinJ family antitoxin
MQAQLRYRVNAGLKKQAEKILENIGCDPANAVAMFYAQIVALGGLPFRPSEFPVLEEYGATIKDADRAEAAVVKEFESDRKADKTIIFTGKLPR